MVEVGGILGRYEVVKLIGEGGMGRVFLGRNTQTGQEVAIKILLPVALQDHPDLLTRFKREGEALRLLNHPNIVNMLEVIETEEQQAIILEYIDGGTLGELLERQPQLPLEQVLQIGIELADALARAHHLKIIHRDIKPANVLLTRNGSPKLTDFGLVRMEKQDNLTRTGVLMGSVSYVSPESLNNAPPDPKVDIWAFGVLLYEMLAGRRPFEGETMTAVLAAILMEDALPLARFRDDLPLPLVQLIDRMLIKQPQDRLGSVRQVGAELENLRLNGDTLPRATLTNSEPISPLPPVTLSTSSTPTANTISFSQETVIMPKTVPITPQKSPKRGNLTLLWVGVLFAVAVIIIGMGVFLNGNADQTQPVLESSGAEVILVEPAAPNEVLILVGQLEPLAAERPVDRFILEDIQTTLETTFAYLPVTVRAYPQIIDSNEQAAAVAAANEATIILWGNYDDDLVEVEVQLHDTLKTAMSEKFLAESGNVKVRLMDVRNQSLVPTVLVNLAVFQAFKGDAYEAASAMLTYEDLDVNRGEIMGVSVGTHVHEHYEILYSDAAAAIESLDAALRLSPSNPFVYNLKAAALERVDDRAQAAQEANTALLLSENQWLIPHIALSNIEIAQGHTEEAIAQLGEAIKISPDDWLPYTMRGSFYFLEGNYEAAKADLQASIEHDPKANFPYVLLMNIAVREGEIEQIGALMTTVLEKFPDPTLANRVILTAGTDPEYGGFYSYLLSAFSNMALQQYDDAVRDLEAAVAIQDDIAEVFLFQGIAYCATGDNEKALVAYGRGLELDPEFTVLYLLRADIYTRENKLGEALADFTAAQQTPLWVKYEPFVNEALAGNSEALGCESFFSATN